MNRSEQYRSMVQDRLAQDRRLLAPRSGDRWGAAVGRFKVDPNRRPDRNLEALRAMIPADARVLDVGGGAGRIGLPLALGCREVVNLEPSPGMNAAFVETAAEAGIANVRAVEASWMDDHGETADVVIACNVTYFIEDIVPFVTKLGASAGRRVVIGVWSVPPPNQDGVLFQVAHGEPQAPYPGHRELVEVLWDMGILPDIRVLPEPWGYRGRPLADRAAALEHALSQANPRDRVASAQRLEAAFDDLFDATEGGFVPRWARPSKELLISWEPLPG